MEEKVEDAIRLIHDSPARVVLFVTGGASHLSSWLLSVPGASSTVLEHRVPYSQSSFLETVGAERASKIRSFASISAARVLAQAAYKRAVVLAPPGAKVFGVGVTCALASKEPKKGDHRALVATYSSTRVAEYELTLAKGHRSRWKEEILSSRLALQALLDHCGTTTSTTAHRSVEASKEKGDEAMLISHESSMCLVRELLVSGDVLHGPDVKEYTDPVDALLRGDIQFAEYTNRIVNRDATTANLIVPGSFNPLHTGHRELMVAAIARYPRKRPAFELSVTNPDKPSLEAKVVRERLAQFNSKDAVLLTRAPLFSLKANMFPNSVFVVGVDTAVRIVDPKYYGGQEGLIKALLELKSQGCSFLVAGRVEQERDGKQSGMYQTLQDIVIPVGFSNMFEAIPEQTFRVDISSSQLRARKSS